MNRTRGGRSRSSQEKVNLFTRQVPAGQDEYKVPSSSFMRHVKPAGYGPTDAQRRVDAAKYYQVSEVEETAKEHIVPRRSLTRQQMLVDFGGKRANLLRPGLPFQLDQATELPRETHNTKVTEYPRESERYINQSSQPRRSRPSSRHGQVKVYSPSELEQANKERNRK